MSDDPTSQANFLQATSQHIDFDWTVDFDARVISGSATHSVIIQEDDLKEIMCAFYLVLLDSSLTYLVSFDTSGLDISTVKVDGINVTVRGASLS